MGYVKRDGDPDTWITKEHLIPLCWYKGECRNNQYAQWKEGKFHYRRYKFGWWFWEELPCPEDDDGYDVFFPQELIDPEHIPENFGY